MTLTIRPGTAADVPAVEALLAQAPEASQWIPDYFLLAECDGQPAGILVTRQVAPREYEILNLTTSLNFRRRGIARALLEHAFAASPGVYFLEVRASNSGALALYRKLGFEAVGLRPRYYSDPEESAIVMRNCS